MNFCNLDPFIIVVTLYVVVIFIIAFVSGFSLKRISDFVLASRKLSGPVAALGAGASDMSGYLLMAVPGIFFVSGLNWVWMPLGLFIGAYLNWLFVAKRLRIYTELVDDAITIPAYFDNRFPSDNLILRLITALVIILFFTYYTSAGFVACALLTQKLFPMPYTQALLLSSIVMISYTCIGGFLAVNWIDFFQGVLMFLALLIVPLVVMAHLGDWSQIVNDPSLEPGYFNPLSRLKEVSSISMLAWGLGYFGQPHILTRFMAIYDHRAVPVARRICMTWMGFALLGAIATGILGRIYYSGQIDDPETIFIRLAMELFNPWVSGFLMAAVLSAIMSSVTAQLINASSALAEDIYHAMFRTYASQVELVFISRLAVIVLSVIAVYLAYDPDSSLLDLVSYAWSGLGSSFGPVILISLYWSKMTRKGAICGMVVGGLTVLIWPALGKYDVGLFKLYEMIPAFTLNVVTIILVSLFDKPVSFSVRETFNEVCSRLK